jgi:hypothetical protein
MLSLSGLSPVLPEQKRCRQIPPVLSWVATLFTRFTIHLLWPLVCVNCHSQPRYMMLMCIFSAFSAIVSPTTFMPTIATMAMSSNDQRFLALRAAAGSSQDVYVIFSEFTSLHRRQPYRFTTFPCMDLRWKPQDVQGQRSEGPLADFVLANFNVPDSLPAFKIRCGVKAIRAIDIMPTSRLQTQ